MKCKGPGSNHRNVLGAEGFGFEIWDLWLVWDLVLGYWVFTDGTEVIRGSETGMQARTGTVPQRAAAGEAAAGRAVALSGVQEHALGRVTG